MEQKSKYNSDVSKGFLFLISLCLLLYIDSNFHSKQITEVPFLIAFAYILSLDYTIRLGLYFITKIKINS